MSRPFGVQDPIGVDPRGYEDVSWLTPKSNGLNKSGYYIAEKRVLDELGYTREEILILFNSGNHVATGEDIIRVGVEAYVRSGNVNHAISAVNGYVDSALANVPISKESLLFMQNLGESIDRQRASSRI